MDFCLSRMFCVVRWRSPRWADHMSREVLQSVACLSVIQKPRQGRELTHWELLSHEKK
jgi:hypothetical protein